MRLATALYVCSSLIEVYCHSCHGGCRSILYNVRLDVCRLPLLHWFGEVDNDQIDAVSLTISAETEKLSVSADYSCFRNWKFHRYSELDWQKFDLLATGREKIAVVINAVTLSSEEKNLCRVHCADSLVHNISWVLDTQSCPSVAGNCILLDVFRVTVDFYASNYKERVA